MGHATPSYVRHPISHIIHRRARHTSASIAFWRPKIFLSYQNIPSTPHTTTMWSRSHTLLITVYIKRAQAARRGKFLYEKGMDGLNSMKKYVRGMCAMCCRCAHHH